MITKDARIAELEQKNALLRGDLKIALANADHWMSRKEELQRKLDGSLVPVDYDDLDNDEHYLLITKREHCKHCETQPFEGQCYRLKEVEK